jgi:hemoglobin
MTTSPSSTATTTAEKSSPYELIGGENTIRQLVHRFYEHMDTLPETYSIRKMHPESLATSEEKLFMYLSGYLGGPNLYIEKFGHPRLRSRHLPFKIGLAERDQWMMCMQLAADETLPDLPVKYSLMAAIRDLADFMRNQPETGVPS